MLKDRFGKFPKSSTFDEVDTRAKLWAFSSPKFLYFQMQSPCTLCRIQCRWLMSQQIAWLLVLHYLESTIQQRPLNFPRQWLHLICFASWQCMDFWQCDRQWFDQLLYHSIWAFFDHKTRVKSDKEGTKAPKICQVCEVRCLCYHKQKYVKLERGHTSNHCAKTWRQGFFI